MLEGGVQRLLKRVRFVECTRQWLLEGLNEGFDCLFFLRLCFFSLFFGRLLIVQWFLDLSLVAGDPQQELNLSIRWLCLFLTYVF